MNVDTEGFRCLVRSSGVSDFFMRSFCFLEGSRAGCKGGPSSRAVKEDRRGGPVSTTDSPGTRGGGGRGVTPCDLPIDSVPDQGGGGGVPFFPPNLSKPRIVL